jgi:plasmid maintenance system antidote protein VapI
MIGWWTNQLCTRVYSGASGEMRKKAQTRPLTDEQNAKLREVVRSELIRMSPKQVKLARLLGVPQGNLSRFLDGKVGGSAALALRVAFLLDRTVEEVIGAQRVVELVDPEHERYPSRIVAVRAAYLNGVEMRTLVTALTTSVSGDHDPGVDWWLETIESGHLKRTGTKKDSQWAIDLVRAGKFARDPMPAKKARRKKAP